MSAAVVPVVRFSTERLAWEIGARIHREGRTTTYISKPYLVYSRQEAATQARDWADELSSTFKENNGYPDEWHTA